MSQRKRKLRMAWIADILIAFCLIQLVVQICKYLNKLSLITIIKTIKMSNKLALVLAAGRFFWRLGNCLTKVCLEEFQEWAECGSLLLMFWCYWWVSVLLALSLKSFLLRAFMDLMEQNVFDGNGKLATLFYYFVLFFWGLLDQ